MTTVTSVDPTQSFIIYGSGDPGTALLRDEFFQRGLKVEFVDIRKTNKRGERVGLITLSNANLNSVPQVFVANVGYVGDYAATMKLLKRVPRVDLKDEIA